jgi:hypothetical protein
LVKQELIKNQGASRASLKRRINRLLPLRTVNAIEGRLQRLERELGSLPAAGKRSNVPEWEQSDSDSEADEPPAARVLAPPVEGEDMTLRGSPWTREEDDVLLGELKRREMAGSNETRAQMKRRLNAELPHRTINALEGRLQKLEARLAPAPEHGGAEHEADEMDASSVLSGMSLEPGSSRRSRGGGPALLRGHTRWNANEDRALERAMRLPFQSWKHVQKAAGLTHRSISSIQCHFAVRKIRWGMEHKRLRSRTGKPSGDDDLGSDVEGGSEIFLHSD